MVRCTSGGGEAPWLAPARSLRVIGLPLGHELEAEWPAEARSAEVGNQLQLLCVRLEACVHESKERSP